MMQKINSQENIGRIQEGDIFENNKQLNKKEFGEKRLVLDSKPIRLGMILTNRCNLKCLMCPPGRHSGDSMLAQSALENMRGLLPYLERINWQGGEVFLVNYLKDIIREASKYKHIEHEIITNGLLIDGEWLKILLDLNLQLIFSIDSVVPKTYEFIRRGAKFKDLIKNLELLNKMEKECSKRLNKSITVVVMRSNLNELELFVDFAKRYNFEHISFHPVTNTDREEAIFDNLTKDLRDSLVSKMAKVISLGREKNIIIYNRLPETCWPDDRENNITDAKPKEVFCSLPWTSLFVDASREEGGVFPHCGCRQSIGNIHSDNLIKLWNSETMVNYRQNMLSNNFSFCAEDCIKGLVDQEILNIYH